jgi:hypothetical protein
MIGSSFLIFDASACFQVIFLFEDTARGQTLARTARRFCSTEI